MDEIVQALSKILPQEQIAEVARAVEGALNKRFKEMQAEMQSKLDEVYEQAEEEKQQQDQIMETGYKQAYEIIHGLVNRLDEVTGEAEAALEEGFDEAYEEVEQLKAEKEKIEFEVYNEANKRLADMRDMFIDKCDQFLALQEQEMAKAAVREIMRSPRLAEQQVAVEKMAEILSDYLSAEDFANVNTGKLEEAFKQVEGLRAQLRIVEAKNVNLARLNRKLDEQVQTQKDTITESVKVERKERVNKRGNASGRGQRVVQDQIINEFAAPTAQQSNNARDLREVHDPLNDLLVLSGLQETQY